MHVIRGPHAKEANTVSLLFLSFLFLSTMNTPIGKHERDQTFGPSGCQ